MKKIFKERLLKLADHLESGKLGHRKFDFGHLHITGEFDARDGFCGMLGCAMGEFPVVFPRHFKFEGDSGIHFKKHNINAWYEHGIREFFDLDNDAVNHLFYPGLQQPKKFGGRMLGDKARRSSVARNIRKFVASQE